MPLACTYPRKSAKQKKRVGTLAWVFREDVEMIAPSKVQCASLLSPTQPKSSQLGAPSHHLGQQHRFAAPNWLEVPPRGTCSQEGKPGQIEVDAAGLRTEPPQAPAAPQMSLTIFSSSPWLGQQAKQAKSWRGAAEHNYDHGFPSLLEMDGTKRQFGGQFPGDVWCISRRCLTCFWRLMCNSCQMMSTSGLHSHNTYFMFVHVPSYILRNHHESIHHVVIWLALHKLMIDKAPAFL